MPNLYPAVIRCFKYHEGHEEIEEMRQSDLSNQAINCVAEGQ